MKRDTDYMAEAFACLESAADEQIRLRRLADRAPLYRGSAADARDRGELDAYRASHRANIACREAIEDAIRDNYHDSRLDVSCVKEITDRFGAERVEYVLANTVRHKAWDERFSPANRAWAETVPVAEDSSEFTGDRRTAFVVDRSHPGLTDLFVSAFRGERQRRSREDQTRTTILDRLRQPVPRTTAPKKQKSDGMEL